MLKIAFIMNFVFGVTFYSRNQMWRTFLSSVAERHTSTHSIAKYMHTYLAVMLNPMHKNVTAA